MKKLFPGFVSALSTPDVVLRAVPGGFGLVLLCLATLPLAAQSQTWVRQLGTSSGDQVLASAPDGSGGVYIGGATYGSLGGPNPSPGLTDSWLARYDGTGNQLWIRQFGASSSDSLLAAAPDGSGGVFVGGNTPGTFGTSNLDTWLARYDSAGNQIWFKLFATLSGDFLLASAPDGSGGVYVGGVTYSSYPFEGNAWLARFDGSGNQLWTRQLGGAGVDSANAIAHDGSGGVYLSGATYGSLGGPNAGMLDAWLARYDSAGNQLWIRQIGTSGLDWSLATAVDGSGGVYLSGKTQRNLGGPSAGLIDAWLAHYDGAGNQLWIQQFGTDGFDEARAMAPDGSGGVYVSGGTDGSLGAINPGGGDSWLAHYDRAGNQLWLIQFGTPSFDYANAIAPDGAGGMYLSGDTSGSLGGPNAGSYDAWLARYAPEPAPYCTAKPNSCGTLPSISSTGTPNATSGGGFTVSATNAKATMAGLLIYTDSGPGNTPFGGGVLCLNTPVKRSIAVLDTTGTPGQCDGTLSIDMNAFAVGALGGNPLPSLTVPGTQINCQFWGRDTIANGALLSDALEYFVGS